MDNTTASEYVTLLGDRDDLRLALLACSAALRLDDPTAQAAVELVVGTNGSAAGVIRQLRALGCVRTQWDGSWYVAEDVRRDLAEQLDHELPEATCAQLRQLLAERARTRAETLASDGQVTAYRKHQAQFEAAVQTTQVADTEDAGANELAELWRGADLDGQASTARAVDYLAPEIHRRLRRIPAEVLFLQGMAARVRGDRRAQERYFGEVWGQGRPGFIYAAAAHLYGILARDLATAERSFRDSIAWHDSDAHRGQVWHSWGNRLTRDAGRARWADAEGAYKTSLQLLDLRHHQAQVWHSYGNLLAKDRARWADAEEAYRTSLQLDDEPHSQGQVMASYADMLRTSSVPEDTQRAEHMALEALRLDSRTAKTRGVANRVLAMVYERRGQLAEALAAWQSVLQTNQELGQTRGASLCQAEIDRLRGLMDTEGSLYS